MADGRMLANRDRRGNTTSSSHESTTGQAGPAQHSAEPMSAWAPLAIPVFRALWIASLASNVGTWMQNVGAAWLMTSLTPYPVLVALMQTATSLPIFLVGLPAGALADVIDRRRLLLITQAWMLAAAAVLSALTFMGLATEGTLLVLTFLLGLGGALNGPAWQAIVPELVGRKYVPSAVALNSAGFNMARAVGPALGGLVVAAAGPGAVFLLNAISFLGVLVVIHGWRRPQATSEMPGETVMGAIAAGMRYATHEPHLQAVLARAFIFILSASALWALLPAVAAHNLGLSATGYGILLGSLGVGAVAGAGILPRLRASIPLDWMLVISSLVFAVATLALGLVGNLVVLAVFMLFGGVAWMAVMSTFNVSVQLLAPAWVRARALGVYLLVFQGGLATGSFGWGAVADAVGSPVALVIAAAALAVGLAAALKWRLGGIQGRDLTPSRHWPKPRLVRTPALGAGPVLVTVEYRVPDENAERFVGAMDSVRRLRRRDGAMRWGLFHDPADPGRYLETFVVPSWAEHLRQHERATRADQVIEARARGLAEPGYEPVVSHYIAASAAVSSQGASGRTGTGDSSIPA